MLKGGGNNLKILNIVLVGIPKVHWYGEEGEFNIMIIDLLGASLEDLFSYSKRRFSLKTILLLANQIVILVIGNIVDTKDRIYSLNEFNTQRCKT